MDAREDRSSRPAHRSRWGLWLGAAAAAALVFAIGYVAGTASAPATAPADSPVAGEGPAEFDLAQTEEDLLPRMDLDSAELDPASSRYIARVDGHDVYLARSSGDPAMICTVLVPVDDPGDVMSGCFGGWQPNRGGALLKPGVVEVTVGEFTPQAGGEPIRLSESVTAYRR